MITHPDIPPDSDDAFVFAELLDLSVSVCTPITWPAAKVEAWVNDKFPVPGAWPYVAVDKSQIMPGTSATPNPCNHAPELRQHWLLFRTKD